MESKSLCLFAEEDAPNSDPQFCENYRRFAKQLKRSMRQRHHAGEKLFIDWKRVARWRCKSAPANTAMCATSSPITATKAERQGHDHHQPITH